MNLRKVGSEDERENCVHWWSFILEVFEILGSVTIETEISAVTFPK